MSDENDVLGKIMNKFEKIININSEWEAPIIHEELQYSFRQFRSAGEKT